MRKKNKNNFTVVDFFCGSGIGAMGVLYSGFNVVYAIDNNKYAINNYNKNIGNHAHCLNIKKMDLNDIPYADVYFGGFPCQPFSLGGKGDGEKDLNRGDLAYYFFEAVNLKKPKAFVLENVKGLLSKKHKNFFDFLINKFEKIGYKIKYKLINSYDYGVPQLRERVFIVGIREDIKKEFVFPQEVSDRAKKVLLNVIYDLPDPKSEHNIKNHNDFYDGGFSPRYISRNRQKQWHEPSFTICSSVRQLPLYPSPPNYDIRKINEYSKEKEIPRRFTARECLRIQTVPDEYYFIEDNLAKNIQCIGNGIPSLIVYKLFNEIENTLR